MDTSRLKKEILFRGTRRGIKELDIVVGGFVQSQIDDLNENELSDLAGLLKETDLDLFAYLNEEKEVPSYLQNSIFKKLKDQFKNVS